MENIDELIARSRKHETTAAEDEQLLAWRQASAPSETYYRDLIRMLDGVEAAALDDAIPDPPAVPALIARGEAQTTPGHNVKAQREQSRHRGRSRWKWWVAPAVAAAIIVGLLLGRAPWRPTDSEPFAFGAGKFVTGPEETATIVLGDGSVVRLAPESRLEILGVNGSRDVALKGTAYFAVAPMDNYPFRIVTEAGEAQVLGTRFELRALGDDLRLVVLEGRVALGAGDDNVEVGAGEMSLVSQGKTGVPVKVEDVRPLIGWLGRFIVFQRTPLRDAAHELEDEYGVRIEVTDSVLGDQTITGWYVDRTFEEVLMIVCGVLQAECSLEDGVATIRPPRDDTPLPTSTS